MEYRRGRKGHAPGHLRDAFLDWLEDERETDTVEIDGDPRPLRWLIGQLWHCTDILPSTHCGLLGLPQGSTYAQAVRKVAEEMEL